MGTVRPSRVREKKRKRKKDEANYRQVTGMHTQGQVPSETAAKGKTDAPAICELPTKQERSTMATDSRPKAKKTHMAKGQM